MKRSATSKVLPTLPDEVIRQRLDDRGDPWWDPARDRLSNLLRLPRRTYKHLFHYSRPDTCHKICRNPEWQHLRSEWRYVHSLFVYIGRPTRILWKVRLPLVINMIVAIVLIINEELNLTHENVSTLVPEFSHEAVIQMIQTTSFVLALLLALRMNRTYERWWDAWRAFRRIGDCAAALTQQAVVFAEGDPPLQAEVARWAVLWCYSVVMFCSGAPELDPMAARLLSEREAAAFNAVPNKFNFVELKLRKLLARVKATVDQGLSIDAHMREGWQCVRTCSTIKQTALPYALTLMCTGFIEIELVLLPIGLIGRPYSISADNFTRSQRATGIMLLLGLYMIINLLLLGADEVASQMEDPFLVLPLNDRTEGVVDLIRRTFDEADELDEAEAQLSPLTGALSLDVQRSETLKRLESIVITVQPLHANDEVTLRSPTPDDAGGVGVSSANSGGLHYHHYHGPAAAAAAVTAHGGGGGAVAAAGSGGSSGGVAPAGSGGLLGARMQELLMGVRRSRSVSR